VEVELTVLDVVAGVLEVVDDCEVEPAVLVLLVFGADETE
jgi:hypothetical protein